MWTSGIVVTVPDRSRLPEALDRLRSVPSLDVGEPIGARIPVATEAKDASAARSRHEWIASLPGVATVEVAFSSFEQSGQSVENSP